MLLRISRHEVTFSVIVVILIINYIMVESLSFEELLKRKQQAGFDAFV